MKKRKITPAKLRFVIEVNAKCPKCKKRNTFYLTEMPGCKGQDFFCYYCNGLIETDVWDWILDKYHIVINGLMDVPWKRLAKKRR